MPFVPATNVVQAEMIYTFAGQRCENVLHYQRGGGWTTAQMDALGGALGSWFAANMPGSLAGTISLDMIRLTDLTTQNSPVIEFVTGLPIIGTAVGDALPNNCALVFTKRTANRGRSYRGRYYHMGMVETQCAGNFVTNAFMASLAPKIAGLLSFSVDSVICPLVVVSRFTGGAPRATAVVTPVTTFAGNTRIDSQRRRLPGVGA